MSPTAMSTLEWLWSQQSCPPELPLVQPRRGPGHRKGPQKHWEQAEQGGKQEEGTASDGARRWAGSGRAGQTRD